MPFSQEERALLSQLSASLEDRQPLAQRPPLVPQLVAVCISCLASVLLGLSIGYPSPAIPDLVKIGILSTAQQQSWFGSLLTVGAIGGVLVSGMLMDTLGRKSTIMAAALPFSLGWLLTTIPTSYIVLYVGRCLTGVGAGMASMVVPIYVGEIASKEYRGALETLVQLSGMTGTLLVYGLGVVLNWQWLALVGSALSALLAILMLLVPETPRWYLKVNDFSEALKTLKWLRGANLNVEKECQEATLHMDRAVSVRELFSRGAVKSLFISLGLMFFQVMSGITAVLMYAESILLKAGFAGNDPGLAALSIPFVQVLALLVACYLMDRVGRKRLLMVTSICMGLSNIIIGACWNSDNTRTWLVVSCMVVYVSGYSIGWAVIPWLAIGEMFPIRTKAVGSTLTATFYWVMTFVITKEFMNLQDISQYGTFCFFGAWCLLGSAFVYFAMPETKGKTLEEIHDHFQSGCCMKEDQGEENVALHR